VEFIHSTKYDKSRLLEVLSLDDVVYDKNLVGTFESVSTRYKAHEEMFIFAVDESNKMCGYICFFPISNKLRNELENGQEMFDDNISAQDIKQYSKNEINNIYIISIAVYPEYRGKGIGFNLVKDMFNYLGKLSGLGYEIGKVYCTVTSQDGYKVFSKFNFLKMNSYDIGTLLYYDFICYKKMDLYLFVPVKIIGELQVYDNKNAFIDLLNLTFKMEVNSLMNQRVKRYFIDNIKFYPEDDYGNTVKTKILDANIFISAYKDIGTLIIEFPSISFDPTYILDQASRSSLKVSAQDGKEILLGNYLNDNGFEVLGNINHLLVSANKLSAYYRQFVLYGEAYFNRIGSKIVSEEAKEQATKNIAQYEFADIYCSSVGVVYEINNPIPSTTYEQRIENSILMIFINEILALEMASIKLLQNTITNEFDNSPKPSLSIIEQLIDSFGKYIVLFEYNYKYHLAKCLSDKISDIFNIKSMRNDYFQNIEQLERIVAIRSEKLSKEFSKKQEALFKIVSVFTLLLSINNVVSLLVGIDFTSKIDLIVFIISGIIWSTAIIYLLIAWIKRMRKNK